MTTWPPRIVLSVFIASMGLLVGSMCGRGSRDPSASSALLDAGVSPADSGIAFGDVRVEPRWEIGHGDVAGDDLAGCLKIVLGEFRRASADARRALDAATERQGRIAAWLSGFDGACGRLISRQEPDGSKTFDFKAYPCPPATPGRR